MSKISKLITLLAILMFAICGSMLDSSYWIQCAAGLILSGFWLLLVAIANGGLEG